MLKHVLLFVASLAIAQKVVAAPFPIRQDSLLPFVNDDTFAASFVKIDAIEPTAVSTTLREWISTEAVDSSEVDAASTMAVQIMQQLQQTGVGSVFLVIGLGDIHPGGGPLAVATPRVGETLETVEMKIREWARQHRREDLAVQRNDAVVLIGTQATIRRYMSMHSANRADLLDPLKQQVDEQAMASIVFCPGPDFRRVVREIWPELPGALHPFTGDLVDRVSHLQATIGPSPEAGPRLVLTSKDAATAEQCARLWQDMPKIVGKLVGNSGRGELVLSCSQLVADSFSAKVEGARVTIVRSSDEAQLGKTRDMLGKAIRESLEVVWRHGRVNHLKALGLGLLNYESAHKRLPPAAICDEQGNPLLSWRVAILPYLEGGEELLKQFHLNEPWDSRHNATLIPKMPGVFSDPDVRLRPLAREGKTTYLVPTGPETVFHDKVGTRYRDITDGTSKTIAIVEVEPNRAVAWTKPEDWQVDLANPREGVRRSDRRHFSAVYFDGHVGTEATDISGERLRVLLTRANGDVVTE